jgi:hypothetical protein
MVKINEYNVAKMLFDDFNKYNAIRNRIGLNIRMMYLSFIFRIKHDYDCIIFINYILSFLFISFFNKNVTIVIIAINIPKIYNI